MSYLFHTGGTDLLRGSVAMVGLARRECGSVEECRFVDGHCTRSHRVDGGVTARRGGEQSSHFYHQAGPEDSRDSHTAQTVSGYDNTCTVRSVCKEPASWPCGNKSCYCACDTL